MRRLRTAISVVVTVVFCCTAACEDSSQSGSTDAASDSGSDTATADGAVDSAGGGDTATEDSGGPGDVSDGGNDGTDGSMPMGPCEELPIPGDSTVRVGPGEAAQLPDIVSNASAGTTILLEEGDYSVDAQIEFETENVTLRSASGDPSKVVLDSDYSVGEMLGVHASDVTIAHLTITNAENHGVHAYPLNGPPSITGLRLYDLRLIDHGEQFVKVNSSGSDDAYVDDGRLECSHFEMTDQGRPNVERCCGGCYTGGIDVHEARGWVVRNNTFRGIYCVDEGLAEHAVHFWTGSRDTVVEQNTIKNCARGIGFGLVQNKDSSRTYDDDPYPNVSGHIGHYDGRIRNNVVWAGLPQMDTGIEIAQTPGATIRHNTVFVTESAKDAFYSSIDYRFPNTDVTIENNLTQRISSRNNAQGTVDSNLESAAAEMFQDPSIGDLHLKSGATDAIDAAISSDVSVDIDGDERPLGADPDIGADEYRP